MRNYIESKVVFIFLQLCILAIVSGCSSVDFISYKDLANDPKYLQNKSRIYNLKQYGGIKINTSKLKDSFRPKETSLSKTDELDSIEDDLNFSSNEDSELIVIQRYKSRLFGESLIHKSKDTRYYLSLGVTYKNQSMDLGLRVEF